MTARRGPCGHIVIVLALLVCAGSLAWITRAAVCDLVAGRTC